MPTVERIETWRGQDVLDQAGAKAGHLEEVYYDSSRSEPVLICVKHGMLGRQLRLVPVADAVLCRDYVRVPFTAEQIDGSQIASVEDELSSEQVDAIGALFKLTLSVSGPVYSAGLIERRRAEAEKARQREEELQVEAQRRAQRLEEAQDELEEARKRASAATEEAHAAERERQKADAATIDERHG
jgi:septin family protein